MRPPAARLLELDERALAAVARRRRPRLTTVARRYSRAGNNGLGWIAVGALAAARRRRVAPLAVTAATVLATLGTNFAVKRLVRRPRPAGPSATRLIDPPASHSFPSAHAATAVAGALALAAVEPPLRPLLPPAVVSMAASRVYLAVHYPSDVVAGLALGGAVAPLWLRAARRLLA